VSEVTLSDGEVERRVAALEALLEQIEVMPGPNGQTARDAVTGLVEVYGEALARLVKVIAASVMRPGDSAWASGDALVAHLLALHGLHPDPSDALEPPGAFIPLDAVRRR
jgi:hypothetical protein